MSEKQRAKLGPTFLGGLVQRSEGPTVSGIHRCVAFDEQGCDLDVSIRRCVVQGNQTPLVLRVDIRSVFYQVLGNLQRVSVC